MKQLVAITLALVLSAVTTVSAKGPVSGPGQVIVGAEASVWDSSLPFDVPNGILPIGGSGQINGEFIISERYGIQIGLHAQLRFTGLLDTTPNKNSKVGIYEAKTGFSSGTRATWNYDWHVDLRNAYGVAEGTTLGDYDLILETDIASSLFGFPEPVDLTLGGAIPAQTVLYQQS